MVESLRKPFSDELEEVRIELIRMSGLLIESIPRCTEALLSSDLAAAQEIIDADNVLDDARWHWSTSASKCSPCSNPWPGICGRSWPR